MSLSVQTPVEVCAVLDASGGGLFYTAVFGLFSGAALLVWTAFHLRRNRRLRQAESDGLRCAVQLRGILRHSRELLAGFAPAEGRFDYLGSACLSLTGYTEDELRALSPDELLQRVHPDDREKTTRLIEQLKQGGGRADWQGVVEYRFLHRDGQYRQFSDHMAVEYNADGRPVYVRSSIRDVTATVRMEEGIRQLEMKYQEGQRLASLGLLASGIAHDFNNLMTVVLGNADLAMLPENGDTGRTALEEIRRAALHAAELATQMMVYSGKTSQTVNCVNLCNVVREMASLLDVSISKKAEIRYQLDEKISPITGDVCQIRQVAMNLITNASDAIGNRPGTITISLRDVELRRGELQQTMPPGGLPAGRYVRLEVADTGPGMDEATVQRIFDPHFTTKSSGRGLGLVSVLNVVQRHKGAVEVKSRPGSGTQFRIYFPIQGAEPPAGSGPAQAEGSVWKGSGTVLVADDESAVRTVTSSLLTHLGFEVITAGDGWEAVDLYDIHRDRIRFLLMDMNMPRLSGEEAVRRIRQNAPRVPVLFMSGYPREQILAQVGIRPGTDFIKKPFRGQDLGLAVRRLLESASR